MRSGADLGLTLQQDSDPAVTGTDATPSGNFTFSEVMFAARSGFGGDLRFGNVSVEHAIPEPTGLALAGLAAAGALTRRKRR